MILLRFKRNSDNYCNILSIHRPAFINQALVLSRKFGTKGWHSVSQKTSHEPQILGDPLCCFVPNPPLEPLLLKPNKNRPLIWSLWELPTFGSVCGNGFVVRFLHWDESATGEGYNPCDIILVLVFFYSSIYKLRAFRCFFSFKKPRKLLFCLIEDFDGSHHFLLWIA